MTDENNTGEVVEQAQELVGDPRNGAEIEYELSTQGDGPNGTFDRESIGNLILNNMAFEELIPMNKGNGDYKTSKAWSWYMTAPDGKRFQIGLSVNEFGPRGVKAKTPNVVGGEALYKLSPTELAGLDALSGTFIKANDVEVAAQLRTIKLVHDKVGGVSFADLKLVKEAYAAAK